jgi:serine protease Do
MKRVVVGIAVIALLAAGAQMLLPARRVEAQVPGILTLEGPGSAIGVTVREATAEEAKAARAELPAGVIVESVRTGSPAEKAGFRTGDLVIEFDGERIRSVRHFTRVVRESPPSRGVRAIVMRGGSRQTLDVVPEVTGDFRSDARELLRDGRRQGRDLLRNFNLNVAPNLRGRRSFDRVTLGVTVTPLTSQLAEYFGVKEGALVTAVTSGSPAAEAGLKAGDVITAIAGRTVSTAADVARQVQRAQSGEGVDIHVTRDRKSLMLKATIPGTRQQPASGRSGLPV